MGISALPSRAQDAWPAESVVDSTNLTSIEGPGANDFHNDLSGAFWNPVTRTLWLVRNGPGGTASKLWAVIEDGTGSFEIDERAAQRGEWTSFGDLEGVTQADFAEDVVYLIIEGQERIKEYDVSVYGTAVLNNDWNTAPHLPRSGGSGAEGITFVPDTALSAASFVDQNGAPYTSTQGMGGLMFVGHQNGGAIFVFDLNRSTGDFVFVGVYATDHTETSGLEFDRSTGDLYAWHDAGFDILSVIDLTSTPVAGQSHRLFNTVASFDGPNSANNEGIAVFAQADCQAGERSFFMTIDDGGPDSLRWYQEFTHGCGSENTPPTANPDALALAEGGTATTLTGAAMSVLDNDTDPEMDPLTANLISGPSHGTLVLEPDGAFSYAHDGGETTTDSFDYQAHDGALPSDTTTVTISITPVNDPPIASPDSLTTLEGSSATTLTGGASSVLANDSDPEGDSLSANVVANPSHGTLSLESDGTFLYAHDGSETTSDSFAVEAFDGSLASDPAMVSIENTPVNDPPIGVADAASVDEGGSVTLLVSGLASVLANDSDPEGDLLSAAPVDEPVHGMLTLSSDGTFLYTHDGGVGLSDSFSYRASDGAEQSNLTTVSITVTPVTPVSSLGALGWVLFAAALALIGRVAVRQPLET
ncbi:MAG: Ig-like domain-containing protein [Myxococcota bacterium]